jgi:hypothetical protein
MKRDRHRVVLMLMLLLLGGAIVNIAVAWGLPPYAPAATQQPVSRYQPPPSGSQVGWDVFRHDSPFAVRVYAHFRGRGSLLPPSAKQIELFPWWSDWSHQLDTMSSAAATALAAGAVGDASRPIIAGQIFEACGWPMFSVQAQWDGRRASVDHTRRWRWGISRTAVVPMHPATRGVLLNELKVLPFKPIWPGFAINTLFYAAILWLLFAAPFALRRRRRIKHGLCAKCGYDLRGSPARADSPLCPECGATVPSPLRGRARVGVGRSTTHDVID